MILQQRTIFVFFSATFLFLAVGVQSAHAQEAETRQKIPRRFALKLGLYHPKHEAVQTNLGNFGYAGLSYDIGKIKTAGTSQTDTKPLLYQAYLDFALQKGAYINDPKSSAFSGSDAIGRLVGIGPALKWVSSPFTSRTQFYIGVGAGYYKVTVPDFGIVQYFNPSGAINGPLIAVHGINGNATAERIGGKVFIGTQGRSGLLGELDYTFLSKVSGLKIGGWGGRIGYRF